MRREEIILESTRKVKLPGVLWIPENEPKAILQITHGMTEHIGRYEKLAEELTEQGRAMRFLLALFQEGGCLDGFVAEVYSVL